MAVDPTDGDGDGLSDCTEIWSHTDPTTGDSDGDGIWDGDEMAWGPNPPATDGDGLDDGLEADLGLDPLAADTDGDGIDDGADPSWIADQVDALPGSTFSPASAAAGKRAAITAQLATIERHIVRGQLAQARDKVAALRGHLDGCGTGPDGDDWVADCAAQVELRAWLDQLDSAVQGR